MRESSQGRSYDLFKLDLGSFIPSLLFVNDSSEVPPTLKGRGIHNHEVGSLGTILQATLHHLLSSSFLSGISECRIPLH